MILDVGSFIRRGLLVYLKYPAEIWGRVTYLKQSRGARPVRRAVLHQAVDEIFVCGQKLRCVKVGLCMTEDAQSATGFGGQVGNVAFPGKIMADSETQKLE